MRSRRQGIVLISILVLTLLATFFIGTLVQMNPSRLHRTVHDESRDRAGMAARAGIDYALNCLKSDVNWRADTEGLTIDSPDLVVREDRGNVLGWIRVRNGPWTGFRLRFNTQDGDVGSGADPFNDPVYPIQSQEISLNNLDSDVDVPLPIGDGSSFEPTGNVGTVVPGRSVGLVVEGVVLSGLDPNDPASLANAPARATRTVEGLYAVSSWDQSPGGGAVLSTAGDLDMLLQPGGHFALRSASDKTPRVRSKESFTLHRDSASSSLILNPDNDAEILVNENSGFQANTVEGGTFQGGIEQADDPFLEVAYDTIRTSKQSQVIEIPAGTYVFSDGNQDSGGTLADRVHYYELSWSDYAARKRAGTLPTPATLPSEFASRVSLDVSRDPTDVGHPSEPRDTVTFERDVQVLPVGSLNELTIAPERGAKRAPGLSVVEPFYIPGADLTVPQDIEIVFEPEEGAKTAYLRAEGDIFLGSNLTGRGGGVVSGGNLDLVGLGQDVTNTASKDRDGLTLYARGGDVRTGLPKGISISTYDERRGKFWDLNMFGSIFSKEDIAMKLGQVGSRATWGEIRFEGAMIALGEAQSIIAQVGEEFDVVTESDDEPRNPKNNDTDAPSGWSGGNTDGPAPTSGRNDISGKTRIEAETVDMIYEPRFMAGQFDSSELDPTFSTISVIER